MSIARNTPHPRPLSPLPAHAGRGESNYKGEILGDLRPFGCAQGRLFVLRRPSAGTSPCTPFTYRRIGEHPKLRPSSASGEDPCTRGREYMDPALVLCLLHSPDAGGIIDRFSDCLIEGAERCGCCRFWVVPICGFQLTWSNAKAGVSCLAVGLRSFAQTVSVQI
jgi:hypothetical protein